MRTDLMSYEGAAYIARKQQFNFGEKFVKQWASVTKNGEDLSGLIEEMREAFAGLTHAEVKRGLSTMLNKTFVPGLSEFRSWCRPVSGVDISWDGPDVAWTKALESLDEAKTIVWTDEAVAAMAVAQPALDFGDKFTAARAFKDHYARAVEKAKAEERMPRYWTSLGTDPEHRVHAVNQAAGLLQLKPEQSHALVGYIEESKQPIASNVSEHLANLKAMLGVPARSNLDAQQEELDAIEAEKRKQIAALRTHQETHIDPFDDQDLYHEVAGQQRGME